MSVSVWGYIVVIVIAYLLGSFPSGYIVGRLWGVDVRRIGSGRTGGTNVLRSAGVVPAFLSIFGDAMKGIIAILIARYAPGSTPLLEALAGLAAVVGHNYSIFLGGRGGAGVMITMAMLYVLSPLTLAIVAPAGLLALIVSRWASLGSLTATGLMAITLTVLVILGREPGAYLIYGFGAAALIYYAHRPNIKRILDGTERKVGQKAEEVEQSQ